MGNDIWQRLDEGKCYVIVGCMWQKKRKKIKMDYYLFMSKKSSTFVAIMDYCGQTLRRKYKNSE